MLFTTQVFAEANNKEQSVKFTATSPSFWHFSPFQGAVVPDCFSCKKKNILITMQNLTTLAITSWSWAVQPKEGSGNHSNFSSTIQNRSPTMGFSSKASWAAFSITFTVEKRLREGRCRQPCLKDLIWVSALSCGLDAVAYSSGVLVRDARQSLHVVTFSIFFSVNVPTQVVYYHVLNTAVGRVLRIKRHDTLKLLVQFRLNGGLEFSCCFCLQAQAVLEWN